MGAIGSLIWKEWREQRWKLGFGCVLLASVTAVGLRARLLADIGIHAYVVVLGGALLPVFVAMGLVAAERADGSLVTLLSLPLRPRTVLLVKLAAGAVVTVTPFAAAFAVALLVAGERELAAIEVFRFYAGGAALGLVVLTWTASLGIGQPSEARVGLVGIGWLGACLLAIPVAEILDLTDPVWHPVWLMVSATPARHQPLATTAAPWAIQGALAAALVVWTAVRFGRRRMARR